MQSGVKDAGAGILPAFKKAPYHAFGSLPSQRRSGCHDSSQDGRVRARAAALAELERSSPDYSRQLREQSSHKGKPSDAGKADSPENPLDFGYNKDLELSYEVGKELGRGGNGVVRVVTCKETGTEFACKSIRKVLDESASEKKREGHAEAVKREVEVLRRLRNCLNVAKLESVYEDATHVHIVMEYCKGGELVHAIGQSHYSERTVASYMRGVLRTLAQCHKENILHRDIKPGNFMLLEASEKSPLKAIDFGLAETFHPEGLPRDDLGLEGTPWYQAPEVLSSAVVPKSDVWSAGVMAFQLLTGRFPFNDKRSPFSPSLSQVWKSILMDRLDFNKPYWDGISDEAKDFVAALLERDVDKRPNAKEALQHPWLQSGRESSRMNRHLGLAVVGRIQRYGAASNFKRTVLEMIAEELLSVSEGGHPACPLDDNARPVVDDVYNSALEYLYEKMNFAGIGAEVVDAKALGAGLRSMGYRLRPAELERLIEQINLGHGSSAIPKSSFAASQIDWAALQGTDRDRWLGLARKAFSGIDADADGFITEEEILNCLRAKLRPGEVHAAVQHALDEAGPMAKRSGGMDFESFMAMLTFSPSSSCLDMYDDRCSSEGSTRHGSTHKGIEGSARGCLLEAIAEA